MAREMTWKEAVIWALRRRGGKSSLTRLYDLVVQVKGRGIDERSFQHSVRSALDGLKRTGRVERVGAGLWRLR